MKYALLLLAVLSLASPALADAARDPALPNPALTPGAAASTDKNEICQDYRKAAQSYSKAHRNVTTAMKETIAAAYGIPRSQWHLYEFDHLDPLSWGGYNPSEHGDRAEILRNLWPQPLDRPDRRDARHKDRVEYIGWRLICEGKANPTDLQMRISRDWVKLAEDMGGLDHLSPTPFENTGPVSVAGRRLRQLGGSFWRHLQ
jgi:hypothetical protein